MRCVDREVKAGWTPGPWDLPSLPYRCDAGRRPSGVRAVQLDRSLAGPGGGWANEMSVRGRGGAGRQSAWEGPGRVMPRKRKV